MSRQNEITEPSRGPLIGRAEGEEALPPPLRPRAVAVLAVAGIIGPPFYAGAALVQSLIRTDHSLMADPIARLAAGPNGWVQHVNFIVLGVLMIAFAIGLHQGVRPARWGLVALVFLVLGGLGQVWAGLVDPFPPPFVLTFLGAGIGLIAMSRRMTHDPRWRSLANYALITGIALLVAVPAGVLLGIPPGSTPRPFSGLASWVLAGIWFVGTVVLALRLRRISTSSSATWEPQSAGQ